MLRPSLLTPQQIVVEIANWLSLLGSVIIILHIPRVIKQAPAQKTRMLIILFIAISNAGFALANVVTDLTNATTYLPCSVSAWCYVFFQLLTCLLIIVSTFRLCGVFLFKQQRPFPTKAVAFCPLVAFILASSPAFAGQYDFDICGRYCWFKLEGDNGVDCHVRSYWAWACFYVWMIVFLAILFGSTSFVMLKIAYSVMHSRSDLKNVVNATMDDSLIGGTSDPAISPNPPPSISTFGRIRSMSQAIQSRTSSILSLRNSKPDDQAQMPTAYKDDISNSHNDNNNTIPMGELRIEVNQTDQEPSTTLSVPMTAHIGRMASLGLDSPTLRSEGILASPSDQFPSIRIDDLENGVDQSNLETIQGRSPIPVPTPDNGDSPAAVLRANERPFYLAILRQALYPISISISGCLQTIVDLTLNDTSSYMSALDYAANIGTSIQGFLFFLVFLFDPAVVQTRRSFRKYMIWKYYIEFYYSLGLPHEGRAFEDQFLQKCKENLNQIKNISQFDLLTRPPPYSWSIQYDDLAMPSDFQTSYPLFQAGVRESTTSSSTAATAVTASVALKNRTSSGKGGSHSSSGSGGGSSSISPSTIGHRGSNRSPSPIKPPGLPATIIEDDESMTPSSTTSMDLDRSNLHPHNYKNHPTADFMSRTPITASDARTDYTPNLPSIPHPLSNQATTTSVPTSVSASSSTVSFSDPVVHRMTMFRPSSMAEGAGTETGAVPGSTMEIELSADENTNLALASPISPYSILENGPRSTWPASTMRHHNSRISTESDDFTFGGSEISGNSRRASLKAPFAGDVLSFPRLTRVTTIGGSDIRSPTFHGPRSSSLAASRRRTLLGRGKGSSSNSKSSSIGNLFRLSGPSSRAPTFSSNSNSNRNNSYNQQAIGCEEDPQNLQPQRSMSSQERYQCQFRWPRIAYLLHQIVRFVYIPRRVRLPPIPNPFSHSKRPYQVEEMVTPTLSIQAQDVGLGVDPDPEDLGTELLKPLPRTSRPGLGQARVWINNINCYGHNNKSRLRPKLQPKLRQRGSLPLLLSPPLLLTHSKHQIKNQPPQQQRHHCFLGGGGVKADKLLKEQRHLCLTRRRWILPATTILSTTDTSQQQQNHINHKVKIFLPCHYDLSQVETCAPFLDRYGGVVFVYDWNVAKQQITDYYKRQYPDGWVKVVPFSLRNILDAIKHLDHRLERYSSPSATGDDHTGSNGSLNSTTSNGTSNKLHQVVILLTASMNVDYGAFGVTQKKILEAVKEALPERVRAVNVIGHCMYGCASCSGVEHKVPLYFTRYFNKTLPYTAKDVLSLYSANTRLNNDNNALTTRTTSGNTKVAHAVLVAPSCGSTSMIAQKPLIQLFHRLEQTGDWKFVWKMHPTSLQLDGYDSADDSGVEQTELENVKFILQNFSVTQEEHACLLPFMEAFDVIITDLHSSVPFIATYFTPKVILSYFNDADYGTPERHDEFMNQLNTFVEPEELEALLNNLPQPKGDPSFFYSQYGHVDGQEDLRFGNMAKWPTEQIETTQPFHYRQAMAQIAYEWKTIYQSMRETCPDDVEGANNALGFSATFPLLQGLETVDIPKTLPRILPRERRAAGIELRIMTYNIWNGGMSSGLPLEQTANAILASGADVVGLQECSSTIDVLTGKRQYMLPELIKFLPGWYYSDQKLRGTSTGPRNPWGVVSKFPIVGTSEKGFGVKIQLNNHRHPEMEPSYHGLPEYQYMHLLNSMSSTSLNGTANGTTNGSSSSSTITNGYSHHYNGHPTMNTNHNPNTRFMYLFNCHLYYFPYQPFQLLKIPYDNQPFLETAEEAVQSCRDTRGKEMESILQEISKVADQEPDVPIFLTGDFNEPSHLDWTPLAVLTGLQPLQVKWPMTELAYRAGLVDLWRAFSPSSTSATSPLSAHPQTPTPTTANSQASFSSVSSSSGALTSPPVNSFNVFTNGTSNLDLTPRDRAELQLIERPGFTWTCLRPETDPTDHYDRIDFIFGLDRESSPIALKEVVSKMGEEVARVGEKNEKILKPWPSDHRAVVATVLL
ncbi:hypothetical protein BGZ83_008745 [Gryganskiella cystojenkinii]|nr:hypothetical protein BGZ83_008745 [Gryganskiella cystojenkinii]